MRRWRGRRGRGRARGAGSEGMEGASERRSRNERGWVGRREGRELRRGASERARERERERERESPQPHRPAGRGEGAARRSRARRGAGAAAAVGLHAAAARVAAADGPRGAHAVGRVRRAHQALLLTRPVAPAAGSRLRAPRCIR